MREPVLQPLACLCLALCFGCAGVPALQPGAEKVALRHSATQNAVRVGVLQVVHGRGCGFFGLLGRHEGAEAMLLNAALDADADYVVVTTDRGPYSDGQCRHNEYILQGVAYKHGTPVASSGGVAVRAASGGLGRAAAVDGCLPGQVYALQDGSRLPDAYGDEAPATELWGCGWRIDLPDGVAGFSGARSGAWYVVRHQGAFTAPTAGDYLFTIGARHAWRLTIDGKVRVGSAGRPVQLSLSAGEHSLLLEYLYLGGRAFALDVQVTRPGGTTEPFSLERGSPYFVVQSVRYTGTRALGDGWRNLASVQADEIRILEQVHFETASAEIRKDDQSEAVLYAVARILAEHPELRHVEVQGHTDDQGSHAYNLELSQRRAMAVRDRLIQAGIAPHRLSARGYGKTRPLDGNASDAGRASNRRVQFVLGAAYSAGTDTTPAL